MRKYIVIVISIIVAILSVVIFNGSKQNKSEIMIKVGENKKISMENYMCNVIISEMWDYNDVEALKAFCIIVRSNIMYSLLEDTDNILDKDNICLPYKNVNFNNKKYNSIKEKVKGIINDTEGEVATYSNRIINLPYHKISAGKTINTLDNGNVIPYLKSTRCDKDIENSNYLKIFYYDYGNNNIELKTKVINEINNSYEKCNIDDMGERLRIVEQGEGHNYGMSLYSAYKMSKEGHTYIDILNKFYNIKIVRVYN